MMKPRLATIDVDGWQLESGEARHRESPETFPIPTRDQREALVAGDAAKLMFDIESEGEDGIEREVERMWVIVHRRFGNVYVGVLDNTPVTIEPDPEILARGSEVVFGPEHIIDITSPPDEYIVEHFGETFFLN
jgi:hypothetical protein